MQVRPQASESVPRPDVSGPGPGANVLPDGGRDEVVLTQTLKEAAFPGEVKVSGADEASGEGSGSQMSPAFWDEGSLAQAPSKGLSQGVAKVLGEQEAFGRSTGPQSSPAVAVSQVSERVPRPEGLDPVVSAGALLRCRPESLRVFPLKPQIRCCPCLGKKKR